MKSPYETIPADQKWTIVGRSKNRAALLPQGAKKFGASRADRIATAGSCFAARVADRLSNYGLNHLVAEPNAGSFSARYGEIYTTRQLRQLFARAFGSFDPMERAWVDRAGRFIDPFRPYAFADGFETIEELEAERARHLAAVRTMFETVDVFVFTSALIEAWSDARDGAVFPNCPGLKFGTFDPERYTLEVLGVDENVSELRAFFDDLHAVNPNCRTVLTVSPIPLVATMLPMHVVRASVLAKSTLKIAAESAARDRPDVDYFTSYDLVTANLGAEQLFESDARHVRSEIADRIVEMMVGHYFDESVASGVSAVRPDGTPGADCDDDRLLALISEIDTPATAAPNRSVSSMSRPLPLYIIGDSTSVVFRNVAYEIEGLRPLSAIVSHIRQFCACDLSDGFGRLNPSVLNALLLSEVLSMTAEGSYAVNRQYEQIFPVAESPDTPYLVFVMGQFDVTMLGERVDLGVIDLPDYCRPERYPERRHDDVPYEVARAAAADHLRSFEAGLTILHSFGLKNIAVHMLAQFGETVSLLAKGREAEEFARTQGLIIVYNHALAAACERSSVTFVDFSDDVCVRRGELDPRFALDAKHLNSEASVIAVRRTLEAFAGRAVLA